MRQTGERKNVVKATVIGAGLVLAACGAPNKVVHGLDHKPGTEISAKQLEQINAHAQRIGLKVLAATSGAAYADPDEIQANDCGLDPHVDTVIYSKTTSTAEAEDTVSVEVQSANNKTKICVSSSDDNMNAADTNSTSVYKYDQVTSLETTRAFALLTDISNVRKLIAESHLVKVLNVDEFNEGQEGMTLSGRYLVDIEGASYTNSDPASVVEQVNQYLGA